MEIHIARDGRRLGPFPLAEVQRMLNAGEASPADLAWTPGSENWVPLATLPGITLPEGQVPPSIPPAAAPPPFHQRAPIGMPTAGMLPSATPPTSGFAVASLVLGIISLVMMPIIASFPAIFFGHIARSDIRRSEGNLSGDGMALAGLITGYLGLAFWVLMFGVMAAMMFAVFTKVPGRLQGVMNNAQSDRAVENARLIAEACQSYAAEHNGSFPARLDDLVPKYLKDRSTFNCSISGHLERMGYTYVGGKNSDSPDKILLYSKSPNSAGKHAVARVDGSSQLEDLPAELQDVPLEPSPHPAR